MIGKIFRATIYSVLVSSALYIALEQLRSDRVGSYFGFAFLFSLIFLIELYTTWAWSQSHLQVTLHRSYHNWVHWVHHLFLPLAAYWLNVLMLYFFENWNGLIQIILVVTFVLFAILFFNLHSYFSHDLIAEKSSNYIYDIIKIYIFFLASSVLSHILNGQYLLIGLCICALSLVLIYLSLSRRNVKESYHFALAASAAVAILVTIISVLLGFGPIKLALMAVSLFYFANATIHHYFEKRLKLSLLAEYLAVLALVVAVIVNLS